MLTRNPDRPRRWLAPATVFFIAAATAGAAELEPVGRLANLGAVEPAATVWATRTLAVGIEVDRDGSRLIAFARKDRPLLRAAAGAVTKRAYVDGERVQFEIVLHGAKGVTFTERADAGALCLLHHADAPPHVEGDTVRVHRDSFIVELPDLDGFDSIEIAYYDNGKSTSNRRAIGHHTLAPDLLLEVPSPTAPDEDATSGRAARQAAGKSGATVLWPEDLADPDVHHVFGSATEATRRINVTIVPDGYTYDEKATMEAHAAALVAAFRNKSPYRELDPFLNYTLVYAYSHESGTDECDCGIVTNTAMGTRFPSSGDSCGGNANRCLYYGSSCDSSRTQNIVEAELRAPVHDTTIVMVNTDRYGGCGGGRAVYSAANASAVEIAIHELGHSIAGLADEYGGSSSCGAAGGGINTSTNGTVGNWPEWIDELGTPHEGARYYNHCVYRPAANCEMRSLFQPFCPVCRQRWALVVLGHSRVAPTAPIEAIQPATTTVVWQGQEATFTVATRLPAESSHTIEWFVEAPGDAEPTRLTEGVTTLTRAFAEPGLHRISVVVTAATDLVKPERHDANRDTAIFEVEVLEPVTPVEVSSEGAPPLGFVDPTTIVWHHAVTDGVTGYNLYRGLLDAVRVGNFGACLQAGLASNSSVDFATPLPGHVWTYLVTGTNASGEGPAGLGTNATQRPLPNPCY